jgi:Phytanoyl-CoA dioxygenase (PhyH)
MLNRFLSKIRRVISDPGYISMRMLGRFNFLRYLMIWLHYQDFSDVANLERKSIFSELNTDEVVDRLKQDGYYEGLQLPSDLVQDLLEFASSSVCHGNRHPEKGFYYKDKAKILAENPDLLLASFYNLNLSCPTLKIIEEDPQILKIAAHYLQSKPIWQGTIMWWSFAVNASQAGRDYAAQLYHMDLDDYRFIKFFFYLTDVDQNGGPHVIVKGTHNKKRFAHQLKMRRYSDREIIDDYGADNVVTLCGSAGYGFVEDTLCFHKGYPPDSQDRLIVQVEFGLRDYGFQHPNLDPQKLKPISV